MAILSKPSGAASTAIAYITIGALLCVWGVVWMLYLRTLESVNTATYYVCAGIILSGVTLLVIGLGLGHIGRSARRAELPPPEVPPTAAATEPAVIIRTPSGNVPVSTAAPAPVAPVTPVAPPLDATKVTASR